MLKRFDRFQKLLLCQVTRFSNFKLSSSTVVALALLALMQVVLCQQAEAIVVNKVACQKAGISWWIQRPIIFSQAGFMVGKFGLPQPNPPKQVTTIAKAVNQSIQQPVPPIPVAKKPEMVSRQVTVKTNEANTEATWVIGDHDILTLKSPAGGLDPKERVLLAHDRLSAFLDQGGSAQEIKPGLEKGQPVIRAGKSIILIVDENAVKSHQADDAKQLTFTWVNALRTALGVPAITREKTLIASRSGLVPALDLSRTALKATGLALTGMASWYGPGFHNRRCSNGERFDMNALTAAHRTLPFNTLVKVTNMWTGKSVLVRITDRGPHRANRIIDLSKGAAQSIGMISAGTAPVKLELMR